MIGPQIGKLLQPYGWYLPYLFAAILLLLNFCYVLFFLPDQQNSVSKESIFNGTPTICFFNDISTAFSSCCHKTNQGRSRSIVPAVDLLPILLW